LLVMAAPTTKRSCLYCDKPTKKGNKGEHIVPEAIGGGLTLNDVSDRAVCPQCNSGFLSLIDRELCSRSYLSIVASQKIDAHVWQTWDIDQAANNLLVEARPSWAADGTLSGVVCYPQIIFERPDRSEVRADSEEFFRFGLEHYGRVLFKAARRCFERYCAGERGTLHFERVQSGVIYEGCRLAPRVFSRHSIQEIAQNINQQSFILRFADAEDKRFALYCLSKLDDGRQLKGWSHKPGSHTPTVCCFFDGGQVLRALMKIGLNLIAAYCLGTPVDSKTFSHAIRLIRGELPVRQEEMEANGFVHADDVAQISGAENEHSFRLVHSGGAWHVFSSFFGGSVGTYVRLPGPNHEKWSCADVVAPIKSKDWRVSTSLILPAMKRHVEWRNSSRVTPSLKMQKSECILRREPVFHSTPRRLHS
jgi:hypothetical protein